ncbi:Isoquinoline 1-oxidoreductase subunit beta [bacterium HR40]|nr:Isoquinoline 1-oxidoreductase subunit beta [bacterium HR40]
MLSAILARNGHSRSLPLLANVSRRDLLRGTVSAGAFVLAARFLPPEAAQAATFYRVGGEDMPNGLVYDPHVFVAIEPDGTVVIVAHRSEMGQGARTSLPMVVADELEADWSRVRIVQAPGDEPRYGNQDTDGSRSMRHHIQSMRHIGASVRHMLEQAAAQRWQVPKSEVRAELHKVVHRPTGRSLDYGELAQDLKAMPAPSREEVQWKDPKDFRYIGTGKIAIYDLRDITVGKAIYAHDVRVPGMKFAVVARPPVVGARIRSYDASRALAVPGVERVVEIPGSDIGAKFAPLGGLAVVASNTWAALKGREALAIDWDRGPHAVYDSAEYEKRMRELARKPGKVVRDQGNIEEAFARAAKVFAAEYYVPHHAHVTMETPAAVADVRDGRAEIWASVQSPWGTRQDVAKLLGVSADDVTVHVTLLGGGFGRKSKCDYVLEAALVSREIGAPVQVLWTREDDIRHGFYHTVSLERLEAAIDSDGRVIGWRHRSVAPTILSTFDASAQHQFDIELGMGLVDNPFDIPNMRMENPPIEAHVRIGWFRSVSNIPRAFAIQSFVAELAHELGKDPKDFLLELIGPPRHIDPVAAGIQDKLWNYGESLDVYPIDTGRLAHVVRVAAEAIGWGRKLPPGHGLGIAVHRSFVTYVATAVEVAVDEKGRISIPVVHTAIDCGFCANPERVKSQIEGAAVQGLTLALYGNLTFANGEAQQSNYHDYPVARLSDAPKVVHTHIVPHPFEVPASGVGEPGVPPFAPALANAVFAATGKRIRDLPLAKHDLRRI